MKALWFILTALVSCLLNSCPNPATTPVLGPGNNKESSIPWNRPAPGEGAGALQRLVNPY